MSYYKRHIFFCTNLREDGRQCCQEAGATEARAYAKQKIKDLGLAGEDGV
ncbi:MAG: (2Fe-2S) ferredoxin domain-containing protein, partial [Gammaproteobacteria bacterium]